MMCGYEDVGASIEVRTRAGTSEAAMQRGIYSIKEDDQSFKERDPAGLIGARWCQV